MAIEREQLLWNSVALCKKNENSWRMLHITGNVFVLRTILVHIFLSLSSTFFSGSSHSFFTCSPSFPILYQSPSSSFIFCRSPSILPHLPDPLIIPSSPPPSLISLYPRQAFTFHCLWYVN